MKTLEARYVLFLLLYQNTYLEHSRSQGFFVIVVIFMVYGSFMSVCGIVFCKEEQVSFKEVHMCQSSKVSVRH